jgi:hypothetical protein
MSAGVSSYMADDEAALAASLDSSPAASLGAPTSESLGASPAASLGPSLAAQLAAGQIVAVQRILARENWRRLSGGRAADDVYAEAVAAADEGFGLLRTGLTASFG